MKHSTKQGRAAAAHLVHTQEVEGSSPSPATSLHDDPLRDALLLSQVSVAQAKNETLISLCERDALWLLLIAEHEGETPQSMISKMIAIRASQIGLQNMAADCGLKEQAI